MIYLTPSNNKIARYFFLDYVTRADVAKIIYPLYFGMHDKFTKVDKNKKNHGSIERVYKEWLTLGYIDNKQSKVYVTNDKGTKFTRTGPKYRLNMNPIFDELIQDRDGEHGNITLTQKEKKLITQLFDKKNVRRFIIEWNLNKNSRKQGYLQQDLDDEILKDIIKNPRAHNLQGVSMPTKRKYTVKDSVSRKKINVGYLLDVFTKYIPKKDLSLIYCCRSDDAKYTEDIYETTLTFLRCIEKYSFNKMLTGSIGIHRKKDYEETHKAIRQFLAEVSTLAKTGDTLLQKIGKTYRYFPILINKKDYRYTA